MDDMLTVDIGDSFLKNAGLRGLLFLLRLDRARENVDYRLEERALLVRKGWLEETDLAALYLRAVEAKFYRLTRLYGVLEEDAAQVHAIMNRLETVSPETIPKEDADKLKKHYDAFEKLLERNSYQAGFLILADTAENVPPLTVRKLKAFKAEKDPAAQYAHYCEWLELLRRPDVRRMLVFKESMYSFLNLFYENFSFFLPANLKKDPANCYRADFVEPLRKYFTEKPGGQKRCLECGTQTRTTRSLSYMIDTNDDPNRKKSAFWNCQPDAFVCPVCAFLYTLVPFGFAFSGGDAVFVNNNQNLRDMDTVMLAYEEKQGDAPVRAIYRRLYRVFTEDKCQMLENRAQNMQVVVRSRNTAHYRMNIVDARLLAFLKQSDVREKLAKLEPVFVKAGEEYWQVYDMVFDNIINRRSQYGLLDRLLRHSLSHDASVWYLWYILDLELLWELAGRMQSDKEEKMEDLKDKAQEANKAGRKLRERLIHPDNGVQVSEEEVMHQLRGTIYRLTNMVGSNNRDAFINTVIRFYAGRDMQIPDIFQDCYKSDELFRAIGHSYILGLDHQKYEKATKGQEDKPWKEQD